MLTPEGRLKKQIKAWLVEHDAYFFMPVPTGYGKKTVDFLCCLPVRDVCDAPVRGERGRFVAIETKSPGKKPTPLQEACLDQIRAAGGKAFWCDSMESFLQQIGGRSPRKWVDATGVTVYRSYADYCGD